MLIKCPDNQLLCLQVQHYIFDDNFRSQLTVKSRLNFQRRVGNSILFHVGSSEPHVSSAVKSNHHIVGLEIRGNLHTNWEQLIDRLSWSTGSKEG